MSQSTLTGGVWKNEYNHNYRLFAIEELYINGEFAHKFRAIGDIPLKPGECEETEHITFASDNHRELLHQIDKWYGNSRRDERHRFWAENRPMVAHNFIVDHPEIKAARLKWLWNNHAIYNVDGLRMESHMDTIDTEYSFAGLRGELLDFLSKYDCWDGVLCYKWKTAKTHIDQFGILHATEDSYDGDTNEYPDDQLGVVDTGDLIDNDEEEIKGMVWEHIRHMISEGKAKEYQFKSLMQEAGF